MSSAVAVLFVFFSIFFFKSFRNTIMMSNGLDPYQDQHFVSPDLGPICLQNISAEDNVAASKD